MKVLIVLVILVNYVGSCTISCDADDEFEDGVTTTEWNQFMDRLQDITRDEMALTCFHNISQQVSITYEDQIIWDLWFKIYSERQNEDEKTLNDCYCEFEDCKSDEFRQCLVEVRKSMFAELTTVFMAKVVSTLVELAQNC